MSIGTLIGIAASASVLAQSAAKKRGRNAQGWAVLAFLFPIALAVLWCLKPRPAVTAGSPRQAAEPGPTSAAKAPVPARPSGWADSQTPLTEQYVAINERVMSNASLAERW
jgi:hypothetical protein